MRDIESGPRYIETSRLTNELIERPKLVFDSDLPMAQKESERVIQMLRHFEITRGDLVTLESADLSADARAIQIVWTKGTPYMLKLAPLSEGRGGEKDILGYRGFYGKVTKPKEWYERYTFSSQGESAEKTFMVPEGLELIIRPTVNKWAIGVDSDLQKMYGNNTRVMYIGIGLLLLGREWMHVGMHEAGHLAENKPNNIEPLSENEAWKIANNNYAKRHRPTIQTDPHGRKNANRENSEFGILATNSNQKIGAIVKFGLTSHKLAGSNVFLPPQWSHNLQDTNNKFIEILKESDRAFQHFVGPLYYE